MKFNRYYYYLLVNTMLVNVVFFVPRIMLLHRFSGAVSGLLIATAIGTAELYLFTYALSRFPGKGFPEILAGLLPPLIRRALLMAAGLVFYITGMITLLVFADITQKYVTPETNVWTIVGSFVAVALYVALIRSERVLYTIEILFVLSVPFLSYVLLKSLFSDYINIDAVKLVAHFYTKMDGTEVIAAQIYPFTGYLAMLVFNRTFSTFKPKLNWLVGIMGLWNLCFSFFIPIALQGADGVSDYIYPWVTTADSMRIELGFVERVLYIFMVLYGFVSFSSIIIQWHVGLELLKSALLKPRTGKLARRIIVIGIAGVFVLAVLGVVPIFNTELLFKLAQLWLQIHMGFQWMVLALLLYAVRKGVRQ